jgi:CDP-diacylglycerol---glycerol-3-phosphate 3-phosphatidyltransferase
MRSVHAAGASDVVRLREWERTSWTYHAKGIWLSPPLSTDATKYSSDPYLTLLGSTNLNARSAALDTELSFILVTSSPELRRSLANEVNKLKEHTKEWQGEDRKVRPGTRVAAALVDGML